MNELLLTGAFKYSEEQIKKIENLGYNITFLQYENERIDCDFSHFTHVVCNSLFMHNDIEKFTNLRFIQITSAGLDRVPQDYIKEKGIILSSAVGVYNTPIAEWVVTKLLDIYKKSDTFFSQQKNKEWIKHRDLEELANKKVAIVGYGNIGKSIAKRLKAFETHIYAVDVVDNSDNNNDEFFHVNDFNNYINRLDIIILTLPLTDQTKNLISYERLTLLKDNTILVNVARGEIINENDLNKFLTLGKNVRIVLDVFEKEPLDLSNPIWTNPNVYISPHNAYASIENDERLFNLIYKKLEEKREICQYV